MPIGRWRAYSQQPQWLSEHETFGKVLVKMLQSPFSWPLKHLISHEALTWNDPPIERLAHTQSTWMDGVEAEGQDGWREHRTQDTESQSP